MTTPEPTHAIVEGTTQMNSRIPVRLAFVVCAVILVVGMARSASAVTSEVTPQAYLPLIQKAAAAMGWDLQGNVGTNPLVNFVGTTDGKPLIIQPGPGNVGIGTTSPDSKLTVRTGAGDDFGFRLTDGTTVLLAGVGDDIAAIGSSHPLSLFSGSFDSSVTLATNGRLGVGTSTPSAKLTVRTTQAGQLGLRQTDGTINLSTFINDGRGYIGTDSDHPLTLISGGRILMNLGTDGRVGIGREPDTGATLIAKGIGASGGGVVGTSEDGVGAGGIATAGIGILARSTTGTAALLYADNGMFMQGFNAAGRRFHINNDGTYVAGSDFAEALPARGLKDSYTAGDVMVLSTDAPGGVERASVPYDPRVAGVYSTRPGVLGAEKAGETRVDIDDVPVAIIGIVPTKVTAEYGPIQVGDQLTTSATPGYAMRCADREKCLGAVIGKAMQPLSEGSGVIKVLVTLR